MDDYQRLLRYRRIWETKKILRIIYSDWYKKIIKDLKPGKTLEIGSGIGNFKKYYPEIISSDIVPCEWLDKCIDAHNLPFPKHSLSNIVMIDVLHHLQDPLRFFREACRVLKTGGKIILMEPFPSPFSLPIYRIFHPEPFIFNVDVFSASKNKPKKIPWSSNQAIPFLLFFKQLDKFNKLFKGKFNIIKREKFSFVRYPLSGGFENKQLIPDWLFPLVRIIEKLLFPLRGLLAFRCYVILQKR
ncbi:MAG: class I SAM-dependent methyltransferase [Candidatus Beckwithbacteria bacterium]|nr:class I SAM-dependent methyltransferase [Candidatus Beckwithbacteria bacterium]